VLTEEGYYYYNTGEEGGGDGGKEAKQTRTDGRGGRLEVESGSEGRGDAMSSSSSTPLLTRQWPVDEARNGGEERSGEESDRPREREHRPDRDRGRRAHASLDSALSPTSSSPSRRVARDGVTSSSTSASTTTTTIINSSYATINHQGDKHKERARHRHKEDRRAKEDKHDQGRDGVEGRTRSSSTNNKRGEDKEKIRGREVRSGSAHEAAPGHLSLPAPPPPSSRDRDRDRDVLMRMVDAKVPSARGSTSSSTDSSPRGSFTGDESTVHHYRINSGSIILPSPPLSAVSSALSRSSVVPRAYPTPHPLPLTSPPSKERRPQAARILFTNKEQEREKA
jgi:hypothetical protein